MFYVYILKSVNHPKSIYVGFTDELKSRMKDHNNGKVKSTKKYIPWNIETYIAFSDKHQALDFEKYLKKGSGHAFMHKRLIE